MGPVRQAAVRQGDRIWTGLRHGQIIQRMVKEEGPNFQKVTAQMQGFVDADGEFLDRKEAFERAVACGQINECAGVPSGETRSLVSEDLY